MKSFDMLLLVDLNGLLKQTMELPSIWNAMALDVPPLRWIHAFIEYVWPLLLPYINSNLSMYT